MATAAPRAPPGRIVGARRIPRNRRKSIRRHGDNENELRRLIDSGQHPYLFHGHTHRRRDETQGSTRVFNPGALRGLQFDSRSYSVVDLDTGEATIIELPNR